MVLETRLGSQLMSFVHSGLKAVSAQQHHVFCKPMRHLCNQTQGMQSQYFWEKLFLQADRGVGK